MDDYESEEETREAEYMRLVKMRAQSRFAVTKAKESEARALAQQNGALTEELRREQKKLQKAVARASSAEASALKAQQACKELQYANRKLQQELSSTQVAAKLASDRSNRCMRNLRDTLYSVEVDAFNKFTRGQQHVQQLIVLTKRLQSQAAGSSISSMGAGNSSSPCQQQQGFKSAPIQQVLSEVFRTLASLGELLTPSPSLLHEADSDAAVVEHTGMAADITCTAHGVSQSASSKLSSRRQRPATAAADGHTAGHCLDVQSTEHVLQVQLNDALVTKAALQRQCDDLQWQVQQQVDRSAAGASSRRLESVQQLADAAFLQAEKQQLQQQVDALQQSIAASQSALQLVRDDHAEQTSRLAAANAEVLRLRAQVSSLEAELVQQQLDVASALSIVSGREAAAVLPLREGEISAEYAAQHRLHVQEAAREAKIYHTGQGGLTAAAEVTSLGTFRKAIDSPGRSRQVHHIISAVRAQQSRRQRDVVALDPQQRVHRTEWGTRVAGASAGSNAHAGTAEQALQQHRGLMPVQTLGSPNKCSTVGADVSAAAAAGGNAAGRAMSPAARYSALVADADAALQRLAECRKVAAAGTNDVVPGQEDSAVMACRRPGAAQQNVVGALGGCQKAGCSNVSTLAAAGPTYRQLFSSGRGVTGCSSKTAAAELLEQAAAAWAVPTGDSHSSSVAHTAGVKRLGKVQQVGGASSQRDPALPRAASGDLGDSSRLTLHELHAELQAMDGDIEAAEAALQAATARFGTQTSS